MVQDSFDCFPLDFAYSSRERSPESFPTCCESSTLLALLALTSSEVRGPFCSRALEYGFEDAVPCLVFEAVELLAVFVVSKDVF